MKVLEPQTKEDLMKDGEEEEEGTGEEEEGSGEEEEGSGEEEEKAAVKRPKSRNDKNTEEDDDSMVVSFDISNDIIITPVYPAFW